MKKKNGSETPDAEDRRRYLGALRAMATTPKAAGLAAYGSGFRTAR